jgi:hypothetical protein
VRAQAERDKRTKKVVQRTAVSCFVELISDGAIIVKASFELCPWMMYAFNDGINDGSQNVYISL